MPNQYPTENAKQVQPSPEQQRQLELFITSGTKIIQSPRMQQSIAQHTKAQDPLDAIASSVVMVMERLERVAQQNGEKLDPDVELQAANVLLGEIIKVYEKSSGQKLSEEQKYQAFSLAISTYLDDAINTGKISKEELAQLADMIKQTPEGRKINEQIQGSGGQPTGQPMQPQANQGPTGILGR